ncbi:MAG: hypothetical protein SFX18_00680, partial [Pirellulales bacterium]|nr:hypothetical protein [Pirellulales bacterium]
GVLVRSSTIMAKRKTKAKSMSSKGGKVIMAAVLPQAIRIDFQGTFQDVHELFKALKIWGIDKRLERIDPEFSIRAEISCDYSLEKENKA